MGRYSIKDLEKLSGIRAHTLRIWEKRYHLLQPKRTDTNIRYYADDDLKKIINIALLNSHGIKISRIAILKEEEIAQKVSELSNTRGNADIHIDELVVAMVDLDEESFEKILASLILRYGFEKAIINIVYPFLEKIGVLWQTGNISPAQEHFISNLIRQKIIVAIDALPLPPRSNPRAMLFLPEQELHELGLLFYHYVVKRAGFRTYYLGQMVPYKDVLSVGATQGPTVLITAITSTPDPKAVQPYLNKLSKDHPQCKIFASGHALKRMALKIPQNLHLFFTATELKEQLERLK